MSQTWEYVQLFSKEMEEKLGQNRHKGDRDGWMQYTAWDLYGSLMQEVLELNHAIRSGESPDAVAAECADVANFAMMIADVIRHGKRGV